MTTATIPLSVQDQLCVDFLLEHRHIASTKADLFRYALRVLAEEEMYNEIAESLAESASGKILYGDIDDLAQKMHI
jgi:hypothetical protein